MKLNRSKKRFIPEGAVIRPDGSWTYYFTAEERAEMALSMSKDSMFGPAISYGVLVCTLE
jgi:hypothetical protein